jgi:uncharacterized membrane protein YphA (DoxX/SURF4 family)
MIMNNAKVLHTWLLLKITYALVPILLGLDKMFTGLIVNWAQYVSPLISLYIPLAMPQFLLLVGVIEIVAGILVWFYPRFGAYVIVAWMGLIIVNLITMNAFYDIIARDIVIAIGALALAWLSDAVQS